ncbi:oligosaccharide flippase family protein [Haladaptatus sp. CMSO5]|uniref:oligosaccharide flippase family protein n=1 Tax=Haladaptatus sp. CMSO5 TaxID=3120514 RepID=UPI002FCE4038
MKIGQTSFLGFVAQFVSSVIGFIGTIYVTRNLGADVFGTYALVVAIVLWLHVIGEAGVLSALKTYLSRDYDKNRYFSAAGVLLALSFTTLTILVLAAANLINQYIGAEFAWTIPILLFSVLTMAYVMSGLEGEHLVHIAGLLEPMQISVRSILHICVVFFGIGITGLLVGHAIGGMIASIIGIYYISARFTSPDTRAISDIISFARFSWLGTISTRTFAAMDTVVLGFFVSTGLIGQYEVAWSLASLLAFFGIAVSKAVFPEVSSLSGAGKHNRVQNILHDALSFAGFLLIPGLVGSVVIGRGILSMYGSEFPNAYTILLVLICARLVYAYGEQFSSAATALKHPEISFKINLVFISLNCSLNLILVYLYGWVGAAVATFLSAFSTLILGYTLFSKILDISFPITEIGYQLLAATIMGSALYGLKSFFETDIWFTLGAVVVGAGLYLAVLSVLSEKFRVTIARNISL